MTVHLDTRPEGVDLMFRPGNDFSLVLTWPESLTGRTFTTSVSTQNLSLTYSVTTMTIVMSDTQTDDFEVDTPLTWALTEDGNDLLIGTWVPSYHASARTTSSVSVSTGTQSVTVSATGSVDLSGIYSTLDSLSSRVTSIEAVLPTELNYIGWHTTTAWDDWDIEIITAPTPVNTYALTAESGVGVFTSTGPTGASGNDRRLFRYNHPDWDAVMDMEVRVEFILGTSGEQFGLGLRCGDGVSVTPWTNVIFNATGTMLSGLWEYSGAGVTPSIVSLSPDQSNVLYVGSVLASTGDGTNVTVTTRYPHGLILGVVVNVLDTPWAAVNGVILTIPSATQFTFASSITGSDTSGSVRLALEAGTTRAMAARVVGTRFEAKQWLPEAMAEPAWGDARYGYSGIIPATTSSGAPAPTSGGVGFMINHVGESGNIRIRDFRVRRL